MSNVSPRGKYPVEMPYESIHEVSNGMTHLNREMFAWVKEHCQPVSIRVTVKDVSLKKYPEARPCFNGSQFGYRSFVHFLSKEEAVLFKLRWG